MDSFFNPMAGLTGVASTTTTTTTSCFMSPGAAADPSMLGMASNRLMNPMGGMGGMDPTMMMMLAQQQQMTNMLLYMIGLMMGLMAGGQGGANPLANLMNGGSSSGGGSSPAGSTSGSNAAMEGSSINTPTNAPNGKVGQFIDIAKAQQGKPYVFGAEGPNAFDCSGLVAYALKQSGVNLPRMTADGYMQHFKNSKVDKNDLKPGDLIFYHSSNDRGIGPGHATHIEIYLGNGMTMGTDSPSEGARIEPINWSTFIGAARVPEFYS